MGEVWANQKGISSGRHEFLVESPGGSVDRWALTEAKGSEDLRDPLGPPTRVKAHTIPAPAPWSRIKTGCS